MIRRFSTRSSSFTPTTRTVPVAQFHSTRPTQAVQTVQGEGFTMKSTDPRALRGRPVSRATTYSHDIIIPIRPAREEIHFFERKSRKGVPYEVGRELARRRERVAELRREVRQRQVRTTVNESTRLYGAGKINMQIPHMVTLG